MEKEESVNGFRGSKTASRILVLDPGMDKKTVQKVKVKCSIMREKREVTDLDS